MANYIVLTNFTDQGIRTVTESVKRARLSQSTFEKYGCKKTAQFWTIGQHDIVTVLEAPNDETAMKAVLAVGKLGNVRTVTMRAFTAAEMEALTSEL
ncbi:MAG: GYD family protein [Betaproteobacteria bacterium RIFCSPLOWO2_02_FULL_62_17]|nr:MAG: GYD family protein [Betaproteobacteria bacterium RIFCSPLOWO2_02_FULL_62_17]